MNSIIVETKVPALAEVMKKIMPLPNEAVFLGMAKDGLPVLYDVSDKESKNIIVWDRIIGQGLRLVKAAIEFIVKYKDQSHYRTEFVILSNNASEWEGLSQNELGVWDKDACVAIVPFWDVVCDQVLFSLAGWCYGKRGGNQPVILFIDGLENANKLSDDAKHNLEYVMAYGRKRNIYIVGTARSENRDKLTKWLEGFQCEIYGQNAIQFFELSGKENLLFFVPATII